MNLSLRAPLSLRAKRSNLPIVSLQTMEKRSNLLAVLLTLLLLLPAMLVAGDAELIVDAGNRDYLDGKWTDALGKYMQVESDGWQSGILYYNMGNCYFKLNELGEAIYYWEKAGKFIGNDPDLAVNLKIARARVADKVDEQVVLPVWGWLDRTRSFLWIGKSRWMVILFSGLLFGVLALKRWVVKRPRVQKWLYWFGWVLALRLVLDLSFVAIDARYGSKNHWGVIFRPEVEVLSAPAEGSGKLLFSLHEGSKVRVLRELDEWIEVRAGKDKQGWVKRNLMGVF